MKPAKLNGWKQHYQHHPLRKRERPSSETVLMNTSWWLPVCKPDQRDAFIEAARARDHERRRIEDSKQIALQSRLSHV